MKSIDRICSDWQKTQKYIVLLKEQEGKFLCVIDFCLFSDKGDVHF